MTLRLSDAELGARLDARRTQAFLVALNPAEGAEYSQCHENAEAYASRHVDCQVVRGWIIEEFVGFTYFNAHSVVRDSSGQLFDPTPIRQHCLFILHEGDEDDFAEQRHTRPRIQYPVLEPDWNDLGGPIDEDPEFDNDFELHLTGYG